MLLLPETRIGFKDSIFSFPVINEDWLPVFFIFLF